MEYRKPKKEINISEEYAKQAAEYMPPENEYTAKNDEYHPLSNEFYIGKSETTQKKKKKSSVFKKVRQMGYLVASSAAVVMTVHTVAPDVLEVVGSEFDYVVQDEYEMDDVEIDDVIVDVQDELPDDDVISSGRENEPLQITYDGAILAGDIHPIAEGRNGIIWCVDRNETGFPIKIVNELGECVYQTYTRDKSIDAINVNGYSLAVDDNLAVILDDKGNETYRSGYLGGTRMYISDNTILTTIWCSDRYETEYSEEYPFGGYRIMKIECRNADGTLVYAEEKENIGFESSLVLPYNEGYAFTSEHLINERGEIINTIDVYEINPCLDVSMVGAYNDGYCVLFGGHPENDWVVSGVDVYCAYLVDMMSGTMAGVYIGEEEHFSIVPYIKNGVSICNYKTYGCGQDYKNGKYFIFDYTSSLEYYDDDTYRSNPIAVFEEIIFDDYEYLAAREGDKYFYIDFQGNVLSKEYLYATPFNDAGYAIVFEEGNRACIINSEFETIHCFENVLTDAKYIEEYTYCKIFLEEFFMLYYYNGASYDRVLYAFDTFTNQSVN